MLLRSQIGDPKLDIQRVKKLGFEILASKMIERFLTSIYILLDKELKRKNIDGSVKIWPSRNKIKVILKHKDKHKDKNLRYLITLINNSFILVAKDSEEVFDKIENNMKEKELMLKILSSILDHFEETKDDLNIKYSI